MNQRVRVQQLHGRTELVDTRRQGARYHSPRLHAQHWTEPLASSKDAVAHGFVNRYRILGLQWQQAVEGRISRGAPLFESFAEHEAVSITTKPIPGGNSRVIDGEVERANCSPCKIGETRSTLPFSLLVFHSLADKTATVTLGRRKRAAILNPGFLFRIDCRLRQRRRPHLPGSATLRSTRSSRRRLGRHRWRLHPERLSTILHRVGGECKQWAAMGTVDAVSSHRPAAPVRYPKSQPRDDQSPPPLAVPAETRSCGRHESDSAIFRPETGPHRYRVAGWQRLSFPYISRSSTVVDGGPGCGRDLLGNRDIADVTTYERRRSESGPTCGQTLSPSSARTAQLEAFRFASAGFPPCLPPVPTPCGRRRKAACLPRTRSETSRGAPLPFPVPEQFFPDAEGILQTWPTGFAPAVIVCKFVHTLSSGFCAKLFDRLQSNFRDGKITLTPPGCSSPALLGRPQPDYSDPGVR